MEFRYELSAVWQTWLGLVNATFMEPRGLLWWPSLLLAGLAAAWLLMNRRPLHGAADRGPYLRELPVDLACFFGYTLTQALLAPLLFWVIAAGSMAVFFIAGVPQGLREALSPPEQWAIALGAFVLGDFFLYWSHRLFHWGPLWRLHALHHQPAVLTPLTAFRFWPPETAVHIAAFSLGEGIAFGLASEFWGIGVTPARVAGVNAILVVWVLAFSQLRHSPVPMPFPRWLSHLLVSPHMHQVHHSMEPRHHHRNFATAFALWDWMFGTLVIPERGTRLRFGIGPDAPMRG